VTTDQKQRNAYKRFWRNRRNYYKAVDAIYELDQQADRSLDLMLKAQDEMRESLNA
jgi:hypothetical protein